MKINSQLYRSPFFKAIEKLIAFHEWAKKTERRKKIFFRLALIFIVIEIQIHIWGIMYWGSTEYWWKILLPVQIVKDIISMFF